MINFRDITGAVLERVVQYFYYKVRYTNALGDIPRFQIDPEYALELFLVSALKRAVLVVGVFVLTISNVLGNDYNPNNNNEIIYKISP